MAITAANLTSGGANSGGTTYTTASYTPSGNRLVLAAIISVNDTPDTNAATYSGNGLTWVEVASQLYTLGTRVRRLTVLRAMGGAPTTGAGTIGFSSQGQSGAAWSIVEFNGIDTGGSDGSSAVVQFATGQAFDTTLTVTLAAFGDAVNNAAFGAFGQHGAVGPQIALGSGFTGISDGDSTNSLEVRTEWKTGQDTSVDATLTDATVFLGIAVEIKAGGAGDLSITAVGNIASEENFPLAAFSQSGQISNAGDIASAESVSTPSIGQPGSIQITTSIAGAESELRDLVLTSATFGAADPDPQFTQYRLTLRGGPLDRTAFAPLGTDFTEYRAFTQVLPGSYIFRLELSNTAGDVFGPGVSKIQSIGAFGTGDLGLGIAPVASIASAEAVSTPTLTAGVDLAGIGNIASAEAVSQPTLITDDVVTPASIPSAEAFSNPSFVIEGVIAPLSIPSDESVSTPSIATAGGAQTIGPNAGDIASAEAVSIPTIAGDIILTAVGDIASSESVSIPTVSTEGVILPLSIASEEAVPQPGIVQAGEITGAGDIASAEVVSIPAIGEDRQILSVGNIPSEENVPVPSVFEGRAILDAGDIASDEDFEDPSLVTASVIAPNSIASEEAFGALITSGAGGTGFRFKPKGRRRVFVVRKRH